MKHFENIFLSFAAPFLILLSILGFFQREGKEKIQALPAFCVGGGLIIASTVKRIRRRKMLLFEIRRINQDKI